MRASILLLTLVASASPFAVHAENRCAHSAPRSLDLNLAGVKTVVFDITSETVNVVASKNAAAAVRGKACASDPKLLNDLVVSQSREGDKLVVRAERVGALRKISWSGNSYAELVLDATVPDTLQVQMKVGSGDGKVEGAASLTGDVGSGDLQVRNIRGMFYADVGSGDIDADGVGGLEVVSVGSGDLIAKRIGGNVKVGSVGSGDLKIEDANGQVTIGSIGSGDAVLSNIGGNVEVDRVGSGDLDINGLRGDLNVAKVGSGSISHRNVSGKLNIPKDD